MKVHIVELTKSSSLQLTLLHAQSSQFHQVVSNPADADIILLLGAIASIPHSALQHPLYRAFPDRCAVYDEYDEYLPLLPGIYCSARNDIHIRVGRVFTYAYIHRHGNNRNRFLCEVAHPDPIGPATPKRYLFSFLGGSTSLVRKHLFNLNFQRDDILIENTSAYLHWDDTQPDRLDRQRRYAEAIAASHFALCPRGAGTSSIRFFEAMSAAVAPVLISDDYPLPPGPDWSKFLLRVRERDISRLPAILEAELPTASERGRLARKAMDEHFAIPLEFDRIVELAALSLDHAPPTESAFRRLQRAMLVHFKLKRAARATMRSAVLEALKIFGLKNPYEMNRPGS